jgi:hypothetical protein
MGRYNSIYNIDFIPAVIKNAEEIKIAP